MIALVKTLFVEEVLKKCCSGVEEVERTSKLLKKKRVLLR
ncbi:hypothetical protein MODO_2469 [Myroides odoratimimus]|nr:hypothetical protein MODO_2469 [Myroides odoratimimus]